MKTIQQKYSQMTFDELKAKYPDRWVLLANPQKPKGFVYETGEFVYKHKSKMKVAEFAGELTKKVSGQHFEIVFTGEITFPQNTVFCF